MSSARHRIGLILALGGLLWPGVDLACADETLGAAKADVSVAARVNGEPITRAEVNRLVTNPAERRQLVEELGTQDPDNNELDRLALRRSINRRLILQEAGRRKFAVTEADLDNAVTSLRRRLGSLKSLGVWMTEQGLDDNSLFETVRSEMLAARVRAALVELVRVTDEQVQEYYDTHKDDLKTEEVRLQIIVVYDKAAAEDIVAALQKGGDFGALARERSAGARAAQGGDTGWIDVEALGPPLRDAVRLMTARQARGPLERGSEYLIVRLGERRSGRAKTLAEARIEIERRLLPAQQQQVLHAWLKEREEKSKIELFPRQK